jgi:hypothetical protein
MITQLTSCKEVSTEWRVVCDEVATRQGDTNHFRAENTWRFAFVLCKRVLLGTTYNFSLNGRADYGMNRLRPLKQWDPGFESNSRHRSLCVFVLCVGTSLATGWSPVLKVLPIMYSSKKLKKRPRQNGTIKRIKNWIGIYLISRYLETVRIFNQVRYRVIF